MTEYQYKPISEEEIWDEINQAESRMDFKQARLWDMIKIMPVKWRLTYLNEDDKFWVVGIYGNQVIWYNDIEEGFNVSRFSNFGTIDEYWCNQDELSWILQAFIDQVLYGSVMQKASPPMEIY